MVQRTEWTTAPIGLVGLPWRRRPRLPLPSLSCPSSTLPSDRNASVGELETIGLRDLQLSWLGEWPNELQLRFAGLLAAQRCCSTTGPVSTRTSR